MEFIKKYPNTILITIIYSNNYKAFIDVLEYNPDINKTNMSNETPLIVSIKYKRDNFAKKLLEYSNINIYLKDKDNHSALYYSVRNNNKNINKLILEKITRIEDLQLMINDIYTDVFIKSLIDMNNYDMVFLHNILMREDLNNMREYLNKFNIDKLFNNLIHLINDRNEKDNKDYLLSIIFCLFNITDNIDTDIIENFLGNVCNMNNFTMNNFNNFSHKLIDIFNHKSFKYTINIMKIIINDHPYRNSLIKNKAILDKIINDLKNDKNNSYFVYIISKIYNLNVELDYDIIKQSYKTFNHFELNNVDYYNTYSMSHEKDYKSKLYDTSIINSSFKSLRYMKFCTSLVSLRYHDNSLNIFKYDENSVFSVVFHKMNYNSKEEEYNTICNILGKYCYGNPSVRFLIIKLGLYSSLSEDIYNINILDYFNYYHECIIINNKCTYYLILLDILSHGTDCLNYKCYVFIQLMHIMIRSECKQSIKLLLKYMNPNIIDMKIFYGTNVPADIILLFIKSYNFNINVLFMAQWERHIREYHTTFVEYIYKHVVYEFDYSQYQRPDLYKQYNILDFICDRTDLNPNITVNGEKMYIRFIKDDLFDLFYKLYNKFNISLDEIDLNGVSIRNLLLQKKQRIPIDKNKILLRRIKVEKNNNIDELFKQFILENNIEMVGVIIKHINIDDYKDFIITNASDEMFNLLYP